MGGKPEITHFWVEAKKPRPQKNQVYGKMKQEIGEVCLIVLFCSFDDLVDSHLYYVEERQNLFQRDTRT